MNYEDGINITNKEECLATFPRKTLILPDHIFDAEYPKWSDRIWYIQHVKDEEDCLERCLKSIKKEIQPYRIVEGIDDRTTDKSEEIAHDYGCLTFKLKWQHSYAEAKNECIRFARKNGLKFGDILVMGGADWEWTYFDQDIRTEKAIAWKSYVPEKFNLGNSYVWRFRSNIWRDHPAVELESRCDEEMCRALYRETGIGMKFGNCYWKDLSVVAQAIHHGYIEDGSEMGLEFRRKKARYQVYRAIETMETKCGWLKHTNQQRLEMCMIRGHNNPAIMEWGNIDQLIEGLVDRWQEGKDFPMGFSVWGGLADINCVDHD